MNQFTRDCMTVFFQKTIQFFFNEGIASGSNPTVDTAYDNSGNHHNAVLKQFALTGTGTNWVYPGGVTTGVSCGGYNAGDISLYGAGNLIPDEGTTTSTTNNTSFGSLTVGSTSTLPYSINNLGTSSLTVSSVTFSGSGASAYSEEVSIKVTDLLGQMVYQNKVTTDAGNLDQQV